VPYNFIKKQNVNLKLGMSKDSPFISEYTEYNRLTKNIFNKSLEPKIKRSASNLKK
jgi:hypothetical protein